MKLKTNWMKCVDPEGKIRPCKMACTPIPNGVLSAWDMRKIGYISCNVKKCNYLAAADRPCESYDEEPMKPIPDYGDHMKTEDFVRHVEQGSFIDHDGHGRYATKIEMSDESSTSVLPSMVVNGSIDMKWTHVVWFNR